MNTISASHANLKRLYWLRIIAIIGQIGAVAITVRVLAIPLPLLPIATIITALAIFNVYTGRRLKRGDTAGEGEFLGQLLVDIAALTALLYFTGGATNPFTLMYFMPLIIAATVLPERLTWALAGITVASHSLIAWQYLPLQHAHAEGHEFGLHVFGMWIGFVLSAGLIADFVVGMGNTLRRQEQALATAREQVLRNERLVALGTLAAGTAHELGTSLNTMTLVVQELSDEYSGDDALEPPLTTLREQLERCKEALSTLSASAGGVRLSGGEALPVDTYLDRLLSEWRDRRPAASVQVTWQGERPAPAILADRSLSQALVNILDNAADASPDTVEWQADWNQQALDMEVRDRGPGLTAEASAHAGKRPYTSKAEGLGLGLFLAHAVIGRFGGSVTLMNRNGGGVCTRIHLPLTRLVYQQAG